MASEFKLKDISSLTIAPGAKREVEVEGIEGGKVLLVNSGGKVQALGAKCTHYGAPMVKGVLTASGRLVCPWHGSCFSTKTGDVEDAPGLDHLPVFDLVERDGAIYVTGEEEAIKSSRRKPKISCKAPSSANKIVVVGGGSATLGLVEGLREKGFDGPITVISREGYLPIDRTKLSKALINDPTKILFRDKAWFEKGSIQWIDGEVTDLDVAARFVTTKSGDKIAFTKLVLATGGTPKPLPLQGFKLLENIFNLRSIHDTKRITGAIGENKGKNIVIIGSSFIGMEVAIATAADNDVTVVGMDATPLEKVLGEKVGAGIQKNVEAKGVKFYMSAGVDKAEPSGSDQSKVGAVYLKDGTKLDADLVILGVGVSPSTEFLRDNKVLSLEKDGSLRTDENFAVVGHKDIYAIGDIATYPYHGPGGGGKPVRIEHWNVAQNAGRTAAAHITSQQDSTGQFIPVFWSALGAQLRYCGNTPNGFDDIVIHGEPGDLKFAAYYTSGEQVVAVASMGMDPVMSQSAELMKLGKMPTKSQLEKGFDVLSLGSPE